MERIAIIKNFLDLVGLTKKERISLLNALMQEWNLKTEDLSTPYDRSTSAAPLDDIDEDASIPAPTQATKTPVIVFAEKDALPTDQHIGDSEEKAEIDTAEQTPAPTEAEDTSKKRRGRRKKAEIDTAEQTPAPTEAEDTPKKRRGRRKKAEIDTAEQTPVPTEAEDTPKKRRGRRKKAEIDTAEQTQAPIEAEINAKEQTPVSSRAKTPQTNRQWCPKKGKTKPTKFKETSLFSEDDPEEDASSAIDDDMIFEKFSSEDKNFIDEAATIENLRDIFEETPKIRSKKTKKRNPAFCYLADYPELMKQKIGYQQPFELLYLWNGHNLLSDYILPDMMPVGIYIPYQKLIFGKYCGFIISIYDEQVIENLTEAIDFVQTKMQAIDGEDWSVMNSIQFGRIKTVSEPLNHMLTKVGGDRLRTTYKTLSPKSNLVNGIGRFRYTIDVK